VPGLTAKGWQVITVDYNNSSDLRFKLAGVDTVISTVSGRAQLALIDCAAATRVRRFVPSEFGGPPTLRPEDDLLDNQRSAAILRLSQRESLGMRFCVFTCGVLFERFAPGGLAASQLGVNGGIGQEGEYIMSYRRRQAQLPYNDNNGQSASVSMIGARDLAQAVVGSLNLSSWPREFRVRSERMRVRDIVSTAEQVQGNKWSRSLGVTNS
jgi:NmrA-like family